MEREGNPLDADELWNWIEWVNKNDGMTLRDLYDVDSRMSGERKLRM